MKRLGDRVGARIPGMVHFDVPEVPPTPEVVVAGFPEPPGLYLHVPFCTSICPFCPYNKVRFDAHLAERYLSALRRELDLYAAAATAPFGSIYIGGGTPTLCLDQLAELLGSVDAVGERAIEVLPNHMTEATATRLRAMGVTHVSIGAQSFDRQVLRHLHRPNTVAMNHAALDVAVSTFECVDVDLMFDVGYQDPQVLLADLRTSFEAGVDQVSTYPVMRFGYTPFGKADHDRRGEHDTLRQAAELAADHGFERRSVWTFNRIGGPAYSSITREFYLGLGAGSASYSGGEFALNHFGIGQYIRPLERGELPIARTAHLGPLQRAAYHLFWQCYTGRVDLDRFHQLFGSQRVLTALVSALGGVGWLDRHDGVATLTPRGYDRYHDLERWVTYHMIEPLWAEMMLEHELPLLDAA